MEERYITTTYIFLKNKYGVPIKLNFVTKTSVDYYVYCDFILQCEACSEIGNCSKNKYGLPNCKYLKLYEDFIIKDPENYKEEIIEEINHLKKCECGVVFYDYDIKCLGCKLQEIIDNQKELEECTICAEKMGNLDSLETECCNQRIHINCYKDSCPFCRKVN